MRPVFLIGFMGAGKSTVGRIVAQRLGVALVDLDRRIEEREGMRVAEIFSSRGEDAFRELEAKELRAVCSEPGSVVACGGGIIVRDENRRILRECGTVVYLGVTAGEALARVGDVSSRPLLAQGGLAAAQTLLAARESIYRAVADLTIDTVGKSPGEVADAVSRGLSELEGSTDV